MKNIMTISQQEVVHFVNILGRGNAGADWNQANDYQG